MKISIRQLRSLIRESILSNQDEKWRHIDPETFDTIKQVAEEMAALYNDVPFETEQDFMDMESLAFAKLTTAFEDEWLAEEYIQTCFDMMGRIATGPWAQVI